MKKQVKNWFRWGAAGAFGLMLTLNVMVGLEFDKDKLIPTLTLMELGNSANAQGEYAGWDNFWQGQGFYKDEEEAERPCGGYSEYSFGIGLPYEGGIIGASGDYKEAGANGRYEIICKSGNSNCSRVVC